MPVNNNETSDKSRPRPRWVRSLDLAEVYANEIHFMWSLDDVRIRVGQLINSPETPNPGEDFVVAVEERAAITFSWRAAKLLHNQLASVIEKYEAVNGPIKTDLVLPKGDN